VCVVEHELDSFACFGAVTGRVGNSETCSFDAISIWSAQKRELFHITAQVLFRRGSCGVASAKIWGAKCLISGE